MEPVTTVGMGLAVIGSKDILVKVLGPTADYVGGELKGLVEKCNINLDQIFIKAKKKLGDRLDEDGVVSPRILKSVLDEGRFCEDDLTAEYYAGVLASSKTKNGRDDRGVSHMGMIKGLSVYQLRIHYLFYFLLKKHGVSNCDLGNPEKRSKNSIFIPFNVVIGAMEFSEDEDPYIFIPHAVIGLATKGLINQHYQFGSQEHMKTVFEECPKEGGIMFEPTILGAELFLWAEGINTIASAEILSSEYELPSPILPIGEGSARIKS